MRRLTAELVYIIVEKGFISAIGYLLWETSKAYIIGYSSAIFSSSSPGETIVIFILQTSVTLLSFRIVRQTKMSSIASPSLHDYSDQVTL
jgi:hypothetical protein